MKALPSFNCRSWTALGNKRASQWPGPFFKRSTMETVPKTLGGHLGLMMGSRTVIEQGIHLCSLQPQASLVVTEKYAQ